MARAADAIDWRRLRNKVIQPLLSGEIARWNAFDFLAGLRSDGTYGIEAGFKECNPSDIIVLEGTYSARPELTDLINLAVLVDVPIAVRHERLNKREEKDFLEAWHARWDQAEEHYFRVIKPPSSFDLIVSN